MSQGHPDPYSYSLLFLSPEVRTAPPPGISACSVTMPIYQSSRPFELTYRFLKNLSGGDSISYGCTHQFDAGLQERQRRVFAQLREIIPHVSFREVNATTQACLNYVLCDNMHIKGGDAQVPQSKLAGISNIRISTSYMDYIDNIFPHETGHALGLRHTHIDGIEPNYYLLAGFTQCTSIMSYTNIPKTYSFDGIMDYLAWSPSSFFAGSMRNDFGRVDEINLRYAYGLDPIGINENQTDKTFGCDPQKSTYLGYLSSQFTWPFQLAFGSAIAIINHAAPVVVKKANQSGYNLVAKCAGVIPALSPPTPSTTAPRSVALRNAIHQLFITGGRVAFPLAAFAHDFTHSVISGPQKDTRVVFACKLAMSTFANGAVYSFSRFIGTIPFYSLYKLSDSQALLNMLGLANMLGTQAETTSPTALPVSTAPTTVPEVPEVPEVPPATPATTPNDISQANLVLTIAKKIARCTAIVAEGTTQLSCRFIVNTAVAEHVLKGSRFYNWANRIHTPPATAAAEVSASAGEGVAVSEVAIDMSANDARAVTGKVIAPAYTSSTGVPAPAMESQDSGVGTGITIAGAGTGIVNAGDDTLPPVGGLTPAHAGSAVLSPTKSAVHSATSGRRGAKGKSAVQYDSLSGRRIISAGAGSPSSSKRKDPVRHEEGDGAGSQAAPGSHTTRVLAGGAEATRQDIRKMRWR